MAFPSGRALATRFFLWAILHFPIELLGKEKELKQWLHP